MHDYFTHEVLCTYYFFFLQLSKHQKIFDKNLNVIEMLNFEYSL